jgi:hypothetical protein
MFRAGFLLGMIFNGVLTALLSGFALRSAISWYLERPLAQVSLMYCMLAALIVFLVNIVVQVAIWSRPDLMLKLTLKLSEGRPEPELWRANVTLTVLYLALSSVIFRVIAIGSFGHYWDSLTISTLAVGCSLIQLGINSFVQLVEGAAEAAAAQLTPR